MGNHTPHGSIIIGEEEDDDDEDDKHEKDEDENDEDEGTVGLKRTNNEDNVGDEEIK